MPARRPSPEEMLARAGREAERKGLGRLKLFFGAAPGVGKTYSMLEEARALARQGADVVIGWVETHGREETARLTEGLERIPPRAVEYRGMQLAELDLDAALARRPTWVLVDELAHTNAPGSRHARRWQDVVELLDAGIGVMSTLNVQHVESLNDVVASITGVSVRETVPDSLIDRADEIELVDLPPDDLLKRLAEGKVYVPAQAERAGANFFKKGNLIALRELALRRTAERVDAQASEWKREQGIDATWRTAERILIAIDASPQSADLIRAGRRMAASMRAPWIVLTVEGPEHGTLGEEEKERLSEHLALAQRLGAETLVVRGENVPSEILAAARERNATRILVGKPRHARWRDLLRGSLVESLVRGSDGIDVLVTSGEEPESRARRPNSEHTAPWSEWIWAGVIVACSTLLCLATLELLTLADQAMLYLLGVLVASSRLSRLPSLAVAVASIAALDWFFVPPFHTFAVSDTRYVLTFLVMLLVAVTVSSRTVRMREQADASRERERRTAALFTMSRDLSSADDRATIADSAVRHVQAILESDAVVLLPNEKGELVPLAHAKPAWFGEREAAVARWVAEHGRPAGHGTDTLPAAHALYLPLAGKGGVLGAFGLVPSRPGVELSPAQRQVLETFVAQTALALERVALREEASRAKLAAEAERTRSALLSTVSHDLRTPLASITGSASVLLGDETSVDATTRRELLETIRDEGDRLGRLVANLLDVTRLESGSVALRREWCPVDEVVDSALGRLEARLAGRDVARELPDEILLAWIDPILVEQALVNLLDNAIKYSPRHSPIEVSARRDEGAVVFAVRDRGPGVPAGQEELVFESFYRGASSGRVEGSGLGLAVVRAVARAHEGTARALPRDGGGATFELRLPSPEPPAIPREVHG